MVADEPTITDYHEALEVIERVFELHKAVDVELEPPETQCTHCSLFGGVVYWPCPTVELLEDFWK